MIEPLGGRVICDEFRDGVPGYFSNQFFVRKDSGIKKITDLKGKVRRVSADIITNERTGQSFYSATIELLPGDLAQAILGQSATPETVAAFREMTNHHSMALLKNYDKWLADRIRESGKAAPSEKGLRAGVGIYYFEQEMDS